ncbi:hypothetical protein HY967_01975 [Candidatus Jorgensenbacteria bacterium]|nr:hypothetical protein [Candidatus Jorgensenbacteria bacterium]
MVSTLPSSTKTPWLNYSADDDLDTNDDALTDDEEDDLKPQEDAEELEESPEDQY